MDTKTQIRLRTTAFAAADYVVNILILLAYAAAGTIAFSVVFKVAAIAVAFNIIFVGGIAFGITRDFRDPSVTSLQVTAACGLNLLGILLAPEITYMFLVNLFVPLTYAVLHFSRRQFLIAWIMLSLATAAVLSITGRSASIAVSTDAERILFPIVIALVLARFVAINAEVSRLRRRLHDKNKDLKDVTAKLAELATHDDLTGIWNRRRFMSMLQEERMRSERTGNGFSVAIVDIDRFKQVNDHFGHLIGDAALKETAGLLQATMRATDRVARYGGEEFVLLFVGVGEDALPVMAERVREAVDDHDWERVAPGLRITLSVGVAAWQRGEDVERLLKRADDALYEAKEAGRNCIRIAA